MKEKLIKSGLLVFILFAVKTAIFYIAVDISIFKNISYIVTLLFFGVSLILYRYCTESTRRVFRFVYLIFSFVLLIDVVYYNYFNQLVSVQQIFQIKNMKGTGESVKAAIPVMSLLLVADLPLLFFIRRKYKLEPLSDRPISPKAKRWIGWCLLICIVITAVNPFGASFVREINSTEAVTVHVKDIVDSTVGKVVYDHSSLGEILERKEIPADVISDVKADVTNDPQGDSGPFTRTAYTDIAKGMNLIVIQVESLQNFVINASYEEQEITPFLNDLLTKDTLYFNHYFTNMGKGNTSDAEFSTQTSLYPVIEGSCYDLYVEDNDFLSLAQLMKDEGYFASAAVGDDKDFYNRATVYEKFGYDMFYNETNLEMDEISGLGLSDKSFFRQMAANLKEQQQPFFSFMLTITNHYPYVLDPIEPTIELTPEDKETLFGGYIQTVRYTDEALQVLFEALKENGLYDNTIVVIYGDHHGLNCLDEDNYQRMTEFLGYSYDYDTMLNVPLIIHIPGLCEARTVETVGGQVDFLPTIANMYGLDLTQSVTLGQDLLNTDEGFVATVAYMLQGSFIKDGVLYEIGRDGSFENGRALDVNTHEELPLDGLEEYSQKAVAVTEMSKYILENNEAVMNNDELEMTLDTVEAEMETLEAAQ